jgi:hypothetical protein
MIKPLIAAAGMSFGMSFGLLLGMAPAHAEAPYRTR